MNNKVFIVYIAFIIFAETIYSSVDLGYGIFIYALIPVSILTLFSIKPEKNPMLYSSLSISPLIRIITISMQMQVISDILLILLLALKEIISTDTRQVFQNIDKSLTMVILPLIISFILNISKILGLL